MMLVFSYININKPNPFNGVGYARKLHMSWRCWILRTYVLTREPRLRTWKPTRPQCEVKILHNGAQLFHLSRDQEGDRGVEWGWHGQNGEVMGKEKSRLGMRRGWVWR